MTLRRKSLRELYKQFHSREDIDRYRRDIERDWRRVDPAPRSGSARKPMTRAEILSPLDSVFIDDALKDDIVTRVAIPDLLEGREPSYNGVILFGPPGTGKTILLRAIQRVYHSSQAYAKEVSTASINSRYFSEFAHNMENELQTAVTEAKKRKKPSFLCFDEGSIVAQKPSDGAADCSKPYQEVMDVMKSYIGNQRMLVVGISTNMLPESFEEALTREGRLTSFYVGYPDVEQRKRMWLHFAMKYGLFELHDDQAVQLAEASPAEQGAFIEEFCRNYLGLRRSIALKAKGFRSLVDALKEGDASVTDAELKKSINFGGLYDDCIAATRAKDERCGSSSNGIGFRPK